MANASGNRALIVTGGGRGIGAAAARRAAVQGHAVCIAYRDNREAADEVMAAIRQAGGKAVAVRADVCIEEDVTRLFDTCVSDLGPVTGLINSAGIMAPPSRVDAMDAARLLRVFGCNIVGSFLCAAEAVRRMSARNGGAGGAIVNVSSVAARLGGAGEAVDYAASKGAIDTLTHGLAGEVAAEGIRVNAVRPGLIYTDIHASANDPDRVDRLRDSVPMKRGGQADEVAQAIVWLLSAEASYTTGAIIDVSGGR